MKFTNRFAINVKVLQVVFFLGVIYGVSSCVDDAQDIRDPFPKDAPDAKLSSSAQEAVGGDVVSFSLNVTDAPGVLDSLGVTSTDDLGTWTSNFDALRGSTSGQFTVDFTMPYNAAGDFTVNITIFDAQVETRKSQTRSSVVDLEYKYPAPTVAFADVTDEIVRGNPASFVIDISEVAPDGVDTVIIGTDKGTVSLNAADLAAIKGKTTGTVRGTLTTAGDEEVGTAEITAIVIDQRQDRSSTSSTDIEVVYQFPAPTVTLTFDQTAALTGDTLTFTSQITAPGTIASVEVASVEDATTADGDELGTAAFDDGSVDAVIGKTSGTVTGTFVSDEKGFINVTVSVTDGQGRTTDRTVQILVQTCDPADIAGMYASVSSGISGDVPTGPYDDLEAEITITGDAGLEFEVSDLSFGLFELQGFDPEPGVIVTCGNEVVSGEGDNGFIDEVTGTINEDGTITLEWSGPFGDSGTTTLTPQ